MIDLLAYAEGPDVSNTNTVIIVIGAGIIAAVCVLAAIPIAMVRRRRPDSVPGIAAVMILWACLAAGSTIYFASASLTWQKEYTSQLMSGYLDPRDQSDRPQMPWILWGGLAVAYGGILFWAITSALPLKDVNQA